MLKQELTGHRYSLRDRLRLFHGTVTPTILYGCEAWTLTSELENRLRRTQRQMLRMILHAPRRRHDTQNTAIPTTTTQQQVLHSTSTAESTPEQVSDTREAEEEDDDDDDVRSSDPSNTPQPQDTVDPLDDLEPWVEWLRRCTHEAEAHMKKLHLGDWVAQQRRRKWRWASRLATTETDAWMTIALRWNPTLDTKHNNQRRQGRPKTRWTDDIRKHIQQTQHPSSNDAHNQHDNNETQTEARDTDNAVDINTMIQMAQNKDLWQSMEESYVTRT